MLKIQKLNTLLTSTPNKPQAKNQITNLSLPITGFFITYAYSKNQVLMTKRIFITGASGFIGKAVVERLLRDDH